MTARRPDEQHRTSTALELFFDLCFVAAVAQAAAAFQREVAAGHGVLGYVLVFFAIWWAWMLRSSGASSGSRQLLWRQYTRGQG
jgi:low temperature requirement protein LtrA